MWNLILLRSPGLRTDDELICHELCHIWQMQHRPLRMPLSYLRFGYERNPYEEEARRAAAPPASGHHYRSSDSATGSETKEVDDGA